MQCIIISEGHDRVSIGVFDLNTEAMTWIGDGIIWRGMFPFCSKYIT